MLIYIYDGSFEGILSAIYESYHRKEEPSRITSFDQNREALFERCELIVTDEQKAAKVYKAVRSRISDIALRKAFHVFLSNVEDKDTIIYRYLRLGFIYGPKVDFYLQKKDVLSVHKLSRKVTLEYHRFQGLIRFSRTESDIYYTRYQPDHNITCLLAPHFAKRFADQNWVIHDTKRGLAAVFNRQEWLLADACTVKMPAESAKEKAVQEIWKEYHRSISINERKNLRLQKNMMPRRYWKDLTEEP